MTDDDGVPPAAEAASAAHSTGVPGDAPSYKFAALLGAASAICVPLVGTLMQLGSGDDTYGTFGEAMTASLQVLATQVGVFLVVQAVMFRSATGVWKPRAYYFPALTFLLLLATGYPRQWLGLTTMPGAFVVAVVIGAVAAVLLEAVLVPEQEKKYLPLVILISLAATATLIAPSIQGALA